jgi:hypothetical protein
MWRAAPAATPFFLADSFSPSNPALPEEFLNIAREKPHTTPKFHVRQRAGLNPVIDRPFRVLSNPSDVTFC